MIKINNLKIGQIIKVKQSYYSLLQSPFNYSTKLVANKNDLFLVLYFSSQNSYVKLFCLKTLKKVYVPVYYGEINL